MLANGKTHREVYKDTYNTPEAVAYNMGYDLCDTWIFNSQVKIEELNALDPLLAMNNAIKTASLTRMTKSEKLCFDVGFLDAWQDYGGTVLPVSTTEPS
jgi:hypothetical protein